MKALILAAGQGDRLEHLTDDIPKALVKVGAKELLCHQFDFLNQSPITSIGVVAGYHASGLVEFIKRLGKKVEIFENTQFEKGSILTLKSALSFLDDDFLMMNVDHIYPKRLLPLILKQAKDITAVCDFDRTLVADDMKVKLSPKGKLSEIHKELKNYDGGYIGMTCCASVKVKIYKKALEATQATLGDKTSVEMILGELAKQGEQIHIANTSGHRWLEVDTLQDLKSAETTLKNRPAFLE